ncbi:MAG TPA: hypothetical protein VLA34_02225, partial [Candidatus Krumholzibacterium sp.]|nr:hypothetical protein [Candidatus Krumholzibacterium sp.]
MKGTKIAILSILVMTALSGSCIFQNEPLRPNTPPVIETFSPVSNDLYAMAPSDVITFTLTASDADSDELTYEFLLSDSCTTSMDSLLGTTSQVDFTAVRGGRYCLQGRVRDGVSFAYRNWFITVIEETNEPPRIVSFTPALDSLTTVLGSRIEFRIGAQDERPEFLRYAYYVNGQQVRSFSSSAVYEHWFLENGRFDV